MDNAQQPQRAKAFVGQAYLIIRIPIFIRPNAKYDSKIGMIVARIRKTFVQTFKAFAKMLDVGKPELWLTPDSDSTVNALFHLTIDEDK